MVFEGPGSVEDYDALAGKQGACLEDAINNIIYRSTLPIWQREFAEALEKTFGVKREVDEEATRKARARDEGASQVLERATRYIARVLAANEDRMDEIKQLAQQVADKIQINPAPQRRSTSAPTERVNKTWLAKARDILSRDEEARETAIAKLLKAVPGFELVRDDNNVPDETSLARLIGRYLDALL